MEEEQQYFILQKWCICKNYCIFQKYLVFLKNIWSCVARSSLSPHTWSCHPVYIPFSPISIRSPTMDWTNCFVKPKFWGRRDKQQQNLAQIFFPKKIFSITHTSDKQRGKYICNYQKIFAPLVYVTAATSPVSRNNLPVSGRESVFHILFVSMCIFLLFITPAKSSQSTWRWYARWTARSLGQLPSPCRYLVAGYLQGDTSISCLHRCTHVL